MPITMPITIGDKKYYNPYIFEGFVFEQYAIPTVTFGSCIPFGSIAKGLNVLEHNLNPRSSFSPPTHRRSLSSIIEYTASYFEQKEKTKLRHGKEWKEKANAFKLGKVCCKCGSDKLLAVHHISNEDYYNLTEKNCIVICKDCHYKIHNPLSK